MEALENVYAGWRRKLMRYIADTVDFELKEPTVVTLGNLMEDTGDIRSSFVQWKK